jgi:hypothetical protein
MALIKKQHLPSGFTVEYWKLAHAQINYDARECRFTLCGYMNEERRRKTNVPATTRDIGVRGEEFDKLFKADSRKNFHAQCYGAAKAKDELLADATEG